MAKSKAFFPKGKRLTPGKYCVGPEPSVGCYNTGFAPCIKRSKRYPDLIAVGYSGDLLDLPIYGKAFRAFLDSRKRYHGKMGMIWLYKTTTAAERRFEELCRIAQKSYQREADEIIALRKKARRGDLVAGLALGFDY